MPCPPPVPRRPYNAAPSIYLSHTHTHAQPSHSKHLAVCPPSKQPQDTPAAAPKAAFSTTAPARPPVDATQDALHAADTPAARSARRRTTGVANMAYVVEKADEAILPASFSFVGAAWNASPGALGDITFVRGIVQALATPLSGILGDRLDRTYVIAGGALLWGVMTIAMGLANTAGQVFFFFFLSLPRALALIPPHYLTSFVSSHHRPTSTPTTLPPSPPKAMVYAAFNGLGLALIIPCIQSLIADYYPAGSRGRAFGALFLTSSLGQVAGGFFATSVGGRTIGRTAGWRFAFFLVGGVSIAAAVLTLALARDPRPRQRGWAKRTAPGLRGALAWVRDAGASAGRDIATVFRIPTFAIIVSQGVVGMMPWVALGFLTAYLQLLGFADLAAALIVAAFNLGTAFGNLLSGFIGDAAVKKFPNAGRIFTAHVSVLLSFPTAAVLLRGLPRGPPPAAYASAAAAGLPLPTPLGSAADAGLYAAAFFIGGLLISWCSTTNSAVFSEVVPPHLRSSIYAFDRSFENAVGNTAGPIVGEQGRESQLI